MPRTSNAYYGPFGDVMFLREPDTNAHKAQTYTDAKSMNAIIASNAAEALRGGMYSIIPNAASGSVHKKLSRALASWLQASDINNLEPCDNIQELKDFAITNSPSLKECFNVPVTIHSDNKILAVGINAFVPAKNVKAPEQTSLIELVIVVAGCNLSTGAGMGSQVQRIQIPYNDSTFIAQSLQFTIPPAKGTLLATGAWLQYYTIKNKGMKRLEEEDFLPACILNARYQ